MRSRHAVHQATAPGFSICYIWLQCDDDDDDYDEDDDEEEGVEWMMMNNDDDDDDDEDDALTSGTLDCRSFLLILLYMTQV